MNTISALKRNTRRGASQRDGAVILLTTVALVVVFMAAALLWNWQIMLTIQKDMQNQADLAALGAADLGKAKLPATGTAVTANSVTYYQVTVTNQEARTEIINQVNKLVVQNTTVQSSLRSNIMATTVLYKSVYNSGTGAQSWVEWTDTDTDTELPLPLCVLVTLTKPKKLMVGENIIGDDATGSSESTNPKVSARLNGKANYEIIAKAQISGVLNGTTMTYTVGLIP